MPNFEYIQSYYDVPACVGRRVKIHGKLGTIVEDRGHYIGVNFDSDKAGVVKNAHPVDGVEYLEMGEIRLLTKSQERYQKYLKVADCFDSFIDFCRQETLQNK